STLGQCFGGLPAKAVRNRALGGLDRLSLLVIEPTHDIPGGRSFGIVARCFFPCLLGDVPGRLTTRQGDGEFIGLRDNLLGPSRGANAAHNLAGKRATRSHDRLRSRTKSAAESSTPIPL